MIILIFSTCLNLHSQNHHQLQQFSKGKKSRGVLATAAVFGAMRRSYCWLITATAAAAAIGGCRQMDCSGLLLLLISYSGFCWRQNLSKCLHKIGNGSWNHTFLSGLWHGIQNLSLSSLGVLTRQDSCVLDGKCTFESVVDSARSLWSYLWSLSWYWWFTIAAGMKSCLFDS